MWCRVRGGGRERKEKRGKRNEERGTRNEERGKRNERRPPALRERVTPRFGIRAATARKRLRPPVHMDVAINTTVSSWWCHRARS